MNNEELRDMLGEMLMVKTRGFTTDRTQNHLDWNEEDPESQFAMVLEDVDMIIAQLEDLGLLKKQGDQNFYVFSSSVSGAPTVTMTGSLGPSSSSVTFPAPTSHSRGVQKSTSVSLSLPAGSTLEELEEYVETLKALQVSPDEVVTTHRLSYSVTLLDCGVERISCGECGYDDYIVLPAEHTCVFD